MGIIRNHLLQMKVENKAEYVRLMEGYETEDDFVRDVLGLSKKAYEIYKKEKYDDKGRFDSGSIRSVK